MKNDRVVLVKDKIAACPSFVSLGLNFTGSKYRQGTSLLGESFVLNFSNERMRSVQVIFHPRDDNKDYFLVNIVNNNNDEIFNIEDWQKKHGLEEKPDPFRLINYSGVFEERLDSFVHYLNGLFGHEKIISIMQGHSWEAVAFDWAGMR